MTRRAKATPSELPVLVWLVDDTAEHHQVADATVAMFANVALEHFHTGVAAVETYRSRTLDHGPLPAVVLMDFFLAGERGDQVTRQLRAVEAPHHRPVIVGYSSVASGSNAIVAAGGDVCVRKVIGGPVNTYLADYLRRFLATRR